MDTDSRAKTPQLERWPLAAVVLALGAFYAPLLLGEQLYRRDTWRLLVPCRDYLGQRLAAGEFPSWFPYQGFGLPFHAQAVCGVLHPLSWLSVWLRPELVLSLQSLTAVALAAWGCWCLARLSGASRAGASLAAVAYALGGYLTSETANIVYLWGAALVPVQLTAFARAALHGWGRTSFLLALASTASTVLMGDFQGAYLFTLAAGAFGLVLSARQWPRYLAGSALCAALLAGVCAAQLLPAWALLQESARSSGITWEGASYWSLHPLRVPELLLPGLAPLGAPGRALALFGSVPGYLYWAEAVGGSAVLSLLALLGLRHEGTPRRLRWALAGLAGLGLWLVLGRHAGLYRVVYEVLPLMRSFRWPEKLLPLFLAPWAVLAALGVERARRASWRPGVWGALGLGLLALGALAGAGSTSAPWESYLRDLAFALALGAGALLAAALAGRVRPALGAPLLFVLVLLETVVSSRALLDTRPLADSARPPESVQALHALGAGLGGLRVSSANLGLLEVDEAALATATEREWADKEREALLALMGSPHGLESISLYLQGYSPKLTRLVASADLWFAALAPRFTVGAVLAPVASAPSLGALGLRPLGTTPRGLTLLKVPDVWPRVWLGAPRPWRPEVDPLTQLARLPRGQVLLEEWNEPPAAAVEGSAEVVSYEPEQVRVAVEARTAAVLVLNDGWASGWSVTVDGEPAPLLVANYLVRGVPVHPGRHDVVFRYEAPGLRLGLLLSAMALGLTLALVAWRLPWRLLR